MFKNLAVSGAIVLGSLCLPSGANARNGTQSHPQPIHFARGAYSKTVTLYLSRQHSEAYFSVRTRADQKMSIKVTPINSHQGIVPAVYVTSPSGHYSGEDAPKARRFDTLRTEAGVYLVRVAPNLMASNGTSGTFRLKVWIR